MKVSTLRSHSKEFLREVIELYKSQPCLWKVNSKDYYNRDKKAEAHGILIEKFKEESKDTDVVDRYLVAKKINCLRSSYRTEKRKVAYALALGREYTPTMWCFDLLRFLDENDKSQKEQEQGPSFVSVDVKDVDDDSNDTDVSPEYLQMSREPSPNPIPETSNLTPKRPKNIENTNSTSRKRRRTIQNECHNAHTQDDDYGFENEDDTRVCRRHTDKSVRRRRTDKPTQLDYASKYWATALNCLPRKQQLYASRIINEVVFQAQIGKLKETTQLVTPESPTEGDTDFNLKGENLEEY